MGQSSIPVLSRNGYSMFWLSSWDDLHSYSTNLNEDIFIRNFFYFMINEKYSTNLNINFSKFSVLNNSNNFNMFKVSNKQSVSEFLYKVNKVPYYISKVRILKFQRWLVVYFYLYNYSRKFTTNKDDSQFINFLKFFKKNIFFILLKKSNFSFDF